MGKKAINRLSLIISILLPFSISLFRLKRENQSRWDDQRWSINYYYWKFVKCNRKKGKTTPIDAIDVRQAEGIVFRRLHDEFESTKVIP